MLASFLRRLRRPRSLKLEPRRDRWDQRIVAVLESLEDRRMLSASVDGAGLLTIEGTADNDSIVITAGANDGEVLVKRAPGVANNTLFTGVDAIQINALAGNDKIVAKGVYTDTGGLVIGVGIDAGEGNDRVTTGHGDDDVDLGDGDDRCSDRGGDNAIDGGSGDDRVKSGDGDDEVDLGDGDDRLTDKGGDNTVIGGAGEDRITTGDGDDSVDAGDDDDRCSDRGGSNEVHLGSGDDDYRGGRDGDHVNGDDGSDDIRGGSGDDYLEGDDGDDRVRGNRGSDSLIGGSGDDDYDDDDDDDVSSDDDDGPEDDHGHDDYDDGEDDDGDEDGDNDGKTSADEVVFAGDNTASFSGASASHDDRDYFKFIAPISGTLDVTITANSGPLAELELEDIFSDDLLELEDGTANGQAAVVAGRTYFVRLRAPELVASEYTVDLAIT